ncbi:MAG: nucleotidyl transferase AbiEii/AbiGii toxin family protein [Thermoplasmatales archaeon]|nr:nucleotidyl transferase AbiEii/AbiGii toxin family protein [Candidatus Thermoplasmatota archaeon]MDA8055550.1 nucleotidyl transferase AbiEii/AbiGii toxin family protein [Thermoplasmatales archaeon]
MIRREELKRVAERKRISISNAEKDYLLEVLLFSISQEIGDAIVLKGGTSLYKLYNLNRFSEDLDFTLNSKKFDYRRHTDLLVRSTRLIGVTSHSTIEAHNNETNIFFSFRGPLYDGRKESACHISLNISHRERLSMHYVKSFFVSSYSDIPAFDVIAMNEKEILAEKIRAIVTREKPRDVYDLWFLLKKGIEVDHSLIREQLQIYGIEFNSDQFKARMLAKERLWKNDLKGLIIGSLPNFSEVTSEIERLIEK